MTSGYCWLKYDSILRIVLVFQVKLGANVKAQGRMICNAQSVYSSALSV